MPFLSLGLQNEESQRDEREGTASSRAANDLTSDNGTAESRALAPASVLPAAIDELREKISARDNVAPDALVRGADEGVRLYTNKAVDAFPTYTSSLDRIPTFTTFKFGYLPVRGLLYSVIG